MRKEKLTITRVWLQWGFCAKLKLHPYLGLQSSLMQRAPNPHSAKRENVRRTLKQDTTYNE